MVGLLQLDRMGRGVRVWAWCFDGRHVIPLVLLDPFSSAK